MWAEDVGPDGKTRRTSSDMYFAEVRPFEEIFREGQSPSGGNQSQKEQQQGSQSGKLAASQKEIINATWKLQRRETGKTPSEPYFKDEPVVQDAQAQALEKAQALKEMTQDPRMSALAENVEKEMQKALDHLTKATNSTKPLPKGLVYELLPSTEATLPRHLRMRRLPAVLVERLNHDIESPLRHLIATPKPRPPTPGR